MVRHMTESLRRTQKAVQSHRDGYAWHALSLQVEFFGKEWKKMENYSYFCGG